MNGCMNMEGERIAVERVKDIGKTSEYFSWVPQDTHALLKQKSSSKTIGVSFALVAAYGFSELSSIVL